MSPTASRTPRQRWTLLGVCAATFMLLLDITIVNVALPQVQRDLHAGLTGVQWVVDAYTATLTALLLTAGTLADRFGRRRIFAIGVGVFTAASALCGAAQSIGMLDVARGVQGIGGAAMFATALALIAQEFRGAARGAAIAVWGSTVGAAVALGPLVGGILTDAVGWRWIFLVNVPVGVATAVLARARMGESRDPDAARLDVAGLITLSGALYALILALLRGNAEGWSSPLIIGLLAGAGALLVLFVIVERRSPRPMLDFALFRHPAFVGVSIGTLAIGSGMFAMLLFVSIYLQDVLGQSPLRAGAELLPMTAFVFALPFVTRRVGVPPRLALGGGFALVSAGLLAMHGLGARSGWSGLLGGLILAGLGIGIANPAIAATAIGVVPPARSGMASGINNMFRLGGVAIGVGALGALLQHRVGVELTARLGEVPHGMAAAVASAGVRAAPAAQAAPVQAAFVSALDTLFLAGSIVLAIGALAAALLVREVHPAGAVSSQPEPEPAVAG